MTDRAADEAGWRLFRERAQDLADTRAALAVLAGEVSRLTAALTNLLDALDQIERETIDVEIQAVARAAIAAARRLE